MKDLREIILDDNGILTKDTVKDLKAIMGADFEIVVKTHKPDRLLVTIKEFECLDKEIIDDIKDIYIPMEEFENLENIELIKLREEFQWIETVLKVVERESNKPLTTYELKLSNYFKKLLNSRKEEIIKQMFF